MDEKRAREILKDFICEDGGLFDGGHYMAWKPGERSITLDCDFELEELEAIVWWMKNMKEVE